MMLSVHENGENDWIAHIEELLDDLKQHTDGIASGERAVGTGPRRHVSAAELPVGSKSSARDGNSARRD